MKSKLLLLALLSSLSLNAAVLAQAPAPSQARAKAETKAEAPKLIIMLAVDQFSADLYEEYAPQLTGGLHRLHTQGAEFVNGYQSHAATETCPGHSTLLTGDRPSRTGIIANSWLNLAAAREDKLIYCAEDESVPGSSSKAYTVSAVHLNVPTLGERLKRVSPQSRMVAVAGKDRAAVMMAGHAPDSIWWWSNNDAAFVSYKGQAAPLSVNKTNAAITQLLNSGFDYPLPEACKARISPLQYGAFSIGAARAPVMPAEGKPVPAKAFYTSERLDKATLDISLGLIDELHLGSQAAPDMLAIGLSATDPIGHSFGSKGVEMCAQIHALDEMLGEFLASLDARHIPYVLAVSADHGGGDVPERAAAQAQGWRRAPDALRPWQVDFAVGRALGITNPVIFGDNLYTSNQVVEPSNMLTIDPSLAPEVALKVKAAAKSYLLGLRDETGAHWVAGVFTREEIAATRIPHTPPSQWSVLERIAASSDAQRSGDIYMVGRNKLMMVSDPQPGTVLAHGSVWDYDRRVPIIFYGAGVTPATHATEVETVDIAPTLASLLRLELQAGEMDGQCVASVAGAGCTPKP